MTIIDITEMGPNEYGVEVEEGHERTGHLVTMSDELVDDLGLLDVQPAQVVRESIGFLLDREPAAALGPEFSLDAVAARYPDYFDELRHRLIPG
jgi:hypothetical protein